MTIQFTEYNTGIHIVHQLMYYRLDGDGEFTDKNGQIWGGNFANKKAIGLQFKHQL